MRLKLKELPTVAQFRQRLAMMEKSREIVPEYEMPTIEEFRKRLAQMDKKNRRNPCS